MVDSLTIPFLGIPLSHLTPLAIFIGYFVLIAYLFVVVLRATVFSSSKLPVERATNRSIWAVIFGLIAVGSFGHTWYHMINYMIWSHSNAISLLPPSSPPLHPLLSITTWLTNTALFEEAWSLVLQPGPKAWISSHITSFTVNWVLFLWLSIQKPELSQEAKKNEKKKSEAVLVVEEKNWGSYEAACVLLLGQVVAISVASSLWFVGSVRRGKSSVSSFRSWNNAMVPRRVWIPLVLSSLSASVVPMTVNTPTFLPNLLLLHFLLLLPFILPTPPTPSSSELYLGAFVLAFVLPLPTFFLPIFLTSNNLLISLLPSNRGSLSLYLPSHAWNTYLTSNHAVGSITADVAWCTVATIAWAWYSGRFFLWSMNKEKGGEQEEEGWGWWVVKRGGNLLEALGSGLAMWVWGSPGFL